MRLYDRSVTCKGWSAPSPRLAAQPCFSGTIDSRAWGIAIEEQCVVADQKRTDLSLAFLDHVRRNENPHRVVAAINAEIDVALGDLTRGARLQQASLGFTSEAIADVARDLRFRLSDVGLPPEDIRSSVNRDRCAEVSGLSRAYRIPGGRDRVISRPRRQSRGNSKTIPTTPGNRICAGLGGGRTRARTWDPLPVLN